MKTNLSFYMNFPKLLSLLFLAGLTASCGLASNPGLNVSQTGVQSQLTPRTKGETLLEGIVVWPTAALKPNSMQFQINYFVDQQFTGQLKTDSQGQFRLQELPAGSHLRLEAHLPDRPQLVFKQEVMLASKDQVMKSEISLDSTAAVALMDYDKKMGNRLASIETKALMKDDTMPMIQKIKDSMMPYLNQNQAIEDMASVQSMIQQVHSELLSSSANPSSNTHLAKAPASP